MNDLPVPPPCPAWCEEEHPADGWEIHPAAITRTCRRVIEVEGDDYTAVITIERFTHLDGPVIGCEAPQLRIDWPANAVSPADALHFAATLTRAAEIVGVPMFAVA